MDESETWVAALQMSFPHDLFYSHIIPDILSEHLHQLLVEDVAPDWHPFYALPLVSRAFRNMCKMMCTNIFGLVGDEGAEEILLVLGLAREYWDYTRLPLGTPPILDPDTNEPFVFQRLMSSKSLIQVYICTAIAHSFFQFDVQWVIALQNLEDADPEFVGLDQKPPRRYKMGDDTMHRVYLPLTCAMKICDEIRPDRLAHIAAKELADMVPRYATAPVLLKYTQDLETYVAREHRVGLETWVEWTSRTLGLIEDTWNLLDRMQRMGKLVNSFTRSPCIPAEVLNETNIISALYDVTQLDWGPDTDDIVSRAWDLLGEWAPL